MARKTREQRPKVRREWTRSPVTQVQPNRREYERQRGKHDIAEALDAYDKSHGRDAASSELSGRILGIDFGERRLGVAVSDPSGRIAQGLDTIETSDPEKALAAVEDLIRAYDIQMVVIGLPKNMDGTEGEMAKTVQAFAGKIEDHTGCGVITWDERLTSTAAERALSEMGRSTKGRKSEIDRIAATIILQGYLDYLRHAGSKSDAGERGA